MATVYLAGAIEACATPEESHAWRAKAKTLLEARGFTVICPNCDGYQVPDLPNWTYHDVDAIVHTDLKFVRKSDLILVNATARSEGTAMEVLYAHNLGIPIVGFGFKEDDIRTFMRYHIPYTTYSLESAVELIERTLQTPCR